MAKYLSGINIHMSSTSSAVVVVVVVDCHITFWHSQTHTTEHTYLCACVRMGKRDVALTASELTELASLVSVRFRIALLQKGIFTRAISAKWTARCCRSCRCDPRNTPHATTADAQSCWWNLPLNSAAEAAAAVAHRIVLCGCVTAQCFNHYTKCGYTNY